MKNLYYESGFEKEKYFTALNKTPARGMRNLSCLLLPLLFEKFNSVISSHLRTDEHSIWTVSHNDKTKWDHLFTKQPKNRCRIAESSVHLFIKGVWPNCSFSFFLLFYSDHISLHRFTCIFRFFSLSFFTMPIAIEWIFTCRWRILTAKMHVN